MKTHLLKVFVIACLMVTACFSQTTVILAPIPVFQSFLSNGTVNAFGCVFTYASQTTTPISSYTDFSGTTLNANPVVLSAGGTANIWIQAGISYTLVIKSSGGTNCASGSTVSTTNGIGGGSSTQTMNVTWSSTPTFTDTAQNQLFTITLAGNTAALPLSVVGILPPAYITFQITQDGSGAHTFTWPSNVVGGASISASANSVSTQQFVWNGTNATALGPLEVGPDNLGIPPHLRTGDLIATGSIATQGGITQRAIPVVTDITNATPVTFGGDTSLHTAYTIPIPGNVMLATGQMRITLTLKIVAYPSGTATINVSYGGTRISPPTTVPASALGNTSLVLVGGNLGATNSQSWEPLELSYLANTGNGNVDHTTSAIDSTVSQNLTVTYQGGANGDSVTFYRIFVEFL